MSVTRIKRCSICAKLKALDQFHMRRHHTRSGRRAACKDCTRDAALPSVRIADRLKVRVRARTHSAIERGELVRAPCARCGAPHGHAHHRRYEGEGAHLDVIWLCQPCHALEHGKLPWTRQLALRFPA